MHFERSSWIDATVEQVFAFHERPDAIELLTPPGQSLKVVKRSGGIEEGAEVEFRIGAGPLKLRWVALHTEFEKNRLFVDRQESGPFASWIHRHQFSAE